MRAITSGAAHWAKRRWTQRDGEKIIPWLRSGAAPAGPGDDGAREREKKKSLSEAARFGFTSIRRALFTLGRSDTIYPNLHYTSWVYITSLLCSHICTGKVVCTRPDFSIRLCLWFRCFSHSVWMGYSDLDIAFTLENGLRFWFPAALFAALRLQRALWSELRDLLPLQQSCVA